MKNKTAQISCSVLVIFCLSVFIPVNGISVTKYSESTTYDQLKKDSFEPKTKLVSSKKVKKKKLKFVQKIKSFFQKIAKKQNRVKDGKKKIPAASAIALTLLIFGALCFFLAFATTTLGFLGIFPFAIILGFFFALSGNETVIKNPDEYDVEKTKKIWKAGWISLLIVLGLFLLFLAAISNSSCCF